MPGPSRASCTMATRTCGTRRTSCSTASIRRATSLDTSPLLRTPRPGAVVRLTSPGLRGSFDCFLQPAPAFFGLGELHCQGGDFVVQAERLDRIGRFQQLSMEGAFLFVELGNSPLQSLDLLAHNPFVLLRR